MENASKALLIAGAILLVIALIAVGMSIFGTARGVVSETEGQIDNMKIQMHNKQFLSYEGNKKSLREAKELLSLIIYNNNNETEPDLKVKMKIYSQNIRNKWVGCDLDPDYYNQGKETVETVSNFFTPGVPFYSYSEYSTGSTYDIKLVYNDKGIIYKIEFYRYW